MTLNPNKFPKYYKLFFFTQEYNDDVINCFGDKIVKIKERCFTQEKSTGLLKGVLFYLKFRPRPLLWRFLEINLVKLKMKSSTATPRS
jgi:hypothetical protein